MATQIGKLNDETVRPELAVNTRQDSPPDQATPGADSGTKRPTSPSPLNEETTIAQTGPVVSRFGRYELLEELSAGGMGVVYRACDTESKRVVALKKIRNGALARPEEVQRFHRETRAVAALRHPNIIELYDVGEHEGQHYFTMALAESGSLDKHLDRFSSISAAVALVEKIARGIQHAHERGVLHRDLKPANVLLDDSEPRVCDFGLAKMTEDMELTQTGQFLGTPAYAAPEQSTEHAGRVSALVDVWSIGVILYQLITGRRPFHANSRDEMLRQIRTTEPPPPSRYRPEVVPALDAIVMKCLVKDPARRCASAGLLADKLQSWLQAGPTVTLDYQFSTRPARRRLAALGGAALAVVLLIGVALGAAYLSTGAPPAGSGPQAVDPSIVLIGELGPPNRLNVIWGANIAVIPAQPNAPFALGSKDVSALELTGSVPWPSYRFEVEVLHDPNEPGEVGMFVGHTPHPASAEPTRSLIAIGFRDRPPTDGHRFNAVMCYMQEAIEPAVGIGYLLRPDSKMFGPLPVPPDTWRSLGVEVTPEEVRIFWQGLHIHAISTAEINLAGDSHFWAVERTHWQFQPLKGLGIYVDSGEKGILATAYFRNATLRPLP
jgi:hypothetical protein